MSLATPPTTPDMLPESLFALTLAHTDLVAHKQSAEGLMLVGHQLERIAQSGPPSALALGILRFSFFRLHHGRIAQLAPLCRDIAIYGEADAAPPAIPGVRFVALPPNSPLTREWFLLLDSSQCWGALLSRAVRLDRQDGLRRYVFESVLTEHLPLISAAWSRLPGGPPPNPTPLRRDLVANQRHWAQLVYALANHSEAARLGLAAHLNDLVPLHELLLGQGDARDQQFVRTLHVVHRHLGAVGAVVYRYDGAALQPVSWLGVASPPALPLHGSISGRTLREAAPLLTPLAPRDPEQQVFPDAQSVVAVPIAIDDHVWGVLVSGHLPVNPIKSPQALQVVGIGRLLELMVNTRHTTPPAPPSLAEAVAQSAAPPPETPVARFELPPWMQVALPVPPLEAARAASTIVPVALSPALATLPDQEATVLQQQLLGALIVFDQAGAERVWQEASARYGAEALCTELLIPIQVAVGEGWHRGEVSVAAEHFASHFVESKLLGLLNSTVAEGQYGPLAVIGCAQHELHELGPLMVALFLRWHGFRVIYLGQNVPNTTIADVINAVRPHILALSATTAEAAYSLIEVGQIVAQSSPPQPRFIFGGSVFDERPELRDLIRGQLLQGDLPQLARQLAAELRHEDQQRSAARRTP
jgi:methanogenic corrinoid protein MtbC1